MKRIVLNGILLTLIIASVGIIVYGIANGWNGLPSGFEDGIKQLNINNINLEVGGVEVNFSDVILSKQKESRKLIVSEQEGEVTVHLTDKVIKQLDFSVLKKSQNVTYVGTGYFVVDLDQLKSENVIDDKENKTLTIKIGHAYLQGIEIDPNNIYFDDVKEGLLARGNIKMSVEAYNDVEKQLRTRLEEKFNTAENGQQADDNALKMVKETYEPIVKAIDPKYTVQVEFE